MSEGKAIAQAGHAYTDSLINILQQRHPQDRARIWAEEYAQLKPGTKICLDGGSEAQMLRLADSLEQAGIPVVRIIDRDHVEMPHFDGSPILTALGIGPIPKSSVPRRLRALPLWRGGLRSRLAQAAATSRDPLAGSDAA